MAKTVRIRVALDSRGAQSGAREVNSSLKSIGTQAEKIKNRIFSVKSALGSLGVGLLGQKFVQFGATFDRSMSIVRVTAGATEAQFDALSAAAERMGATTEFTATQAANAEKFLAMAGLSVIQTLKALPQMLDLATAGQLDLAMAADISTNILTQMGLKVEELTRVNDALISVQATANTSVIEAAQAFTYAGSMASKFHTDVEELNGIIGMLANSGIKASMAGTTIRQSMISLLNPTGDSLDILKKYNIEVTKTDGTLRSFVDILYDLGDANIGAQESTKLFGARAQNITNVIKDGREPLRKYIEQIRSMEGVSQSAAEAIRSDVQGSIDTLTSTMQGVALDVWNEYRDEVQDSLTDITSWLRDNKDEIEDYVDRLIGLGKGIGEALSTAKPVIGVMGEMFTSALEGYNSLPESIQTLGVIGTVLFGKSGLAVAMGAGIMTDWVLRLKKGLELAEEGFISYEDVIFATRSELIALIDAHEKIGPGVNTDLAQTKAELALAQREYEEAYANFSKVGIFGDEQARRWDVAEGILEKIDLLKEKIRSLEDVQAGTSDYWKIYSVGIREAEVSVSGLLAEIDPLSGLMDEVSDSTTKVLKTFVPLAELIEKTGKTPIFNITATDADNAQAWIDDTRTSMERYQAKIKEIVSLQEKGAFADTPDAYARAIQLAYDEMIAATEDASDDTIKIWENTRDAVQNSISGFFDSAGSGQFDSFKDIMSELGTSSGQIFTANLSQSIMEGLKDSEISTALEDMFSGIFKGSAGSDIMSGLLGTFSAGVSAVQSGNEYQMGGTALGAGIGAMFGPLGMGAGSMIGGGIGGLFGGDDGPSYSDMLADKIDELIISLDKTTQALRDELFGVSEFTTILRSAKDSVLNDNLGDMGSLTEEMNLPGGMKKRDTPWYQSAALSLAGTVLGFVPGVGYLAGEYLKKDKGYTAYDMKEDQLSDTMETLFDSMNIAELFDLFKASSTDAGALMDMLADKNLLNPEIPDRVVDWYSDSGGSKNIEKVSEGITAVLEQAVLNVLTTAQSLVDQTEGYIGAYDDSQLTAYDLAVKKVNTSLEDFKTQSAEAIPVLQSMIASENISTENKKKAQEQLDKLLASEAEYGRVLESTTAEFEKTQDSIGVDMARALGLATGKLTDFEVAMMGISERGTEYKESLVDNGMALNDAIHKTEQWTQAMKAQAKIEQEKADSISDIGTVTSANDLAFSMTGDKDILVDQMDQLQKLMLLATTPEEQLDILSKQNTLLQQIYEVEVDSLKEQIQSVVSIRSKIDDLQGSMVTPESMEYFKKRYDVLYQTAMASGDSDDIDALLGFLDDYESFADAYGVDMNSMKQSWSNDLTSLETAITNGASLSDLRDQLEQIESNTASIEGVTLSMEDIKEGLRDIIRSTGNVPSFATGGMHSGGFAIAGEKGPEPIWTGGQAKVGSSEDFYNNLTDSLSKALENNIKSEQPAQQVSTKLIMQIRERVLGDVMADLINTHGEVNRALDKKINKIYRRNG